MDFYLLALIVGGGLLLLSLLGGHDTDAGDLHTDLHTEASGPHTEPGDLASWFSLRSLVSFTAFFGLAGVLGRWLGLGSTTQLLTALLTGLLAGAVTAYTFRLARRHGNVSFEPATLVGRVGQVTVPLAPGRPGRVLVAVGAGTEQLTARSDIPLGAGRQVIVTAEEGGVLEVQPWDNL
ncbi:hypothetical protein Deipr_1034 [Deinococcus proteolyticus MRP]|uniref:Uncharacterized protein n=1 Tax=Deinococcus proteolyticus (strain ATCC 35074 / DSM 20540 / JCM 6276 / NBRC 101906 / NCIMB 13154 / VKM Ac-1939 / CCM 2703 / MRP) TaxID=693977 RepID=F0RN48_DEIPM|nr:MULTISPECIES: NfeD family protein [Deinococcus]ADY26190.1 hypothetical protein Deipr_1034 [Deinococcus proteolyticus MRP]MCY1702310.1 NfeD family protein [Deinococcus sp. SL84]